MKSKSLILILALALLLTACGGNTPPANENGAEGNNQAVETEETGNPDDSALYVGAASVVESLDAHKDWLGWEYARYAIGETLFDLDNDYKVVPMLAEKYENIDPLTWEVTLNDKATFSNGEKVTADKVVKSLLRTVEINPEAAIFEDIEITADGDDKVILKTKEPFPALMNELTDPHFTIIDVDGTENPDEGCIATGPYKVLSFTPNEEMKLEPNTNYWNGTPKLTGIQVKAIPDENTRQLAIQSGQVDVAYVSTDALPIFEEGDFKTYSVPSSRVYLIYMNPETFPDPQVRKEILSAIDRKTIVSDLMKDAITLTKGPFLADLPYGYEGLDIVSYNPDAKAATDQPIDLRFYERLNIDKLATEIQSQLSQAGYTVNATQNENSKYLNARDYDMGLYGNITLRTGDPYSYLESVFRLGGSANFNDFDDPEVNALLDEMKTEFDTEKRYELAREITQKALDHNLHYYIGNVSIDIVSQENIEGVVESPFDFKLVSVDTAKK